MFKDCHNYCMGSPGNPKHTSLSESTAAINQLIHQSIKKGNLTADLILQHSGINVLSLKTDQNHSTDHRKTL